MADTPKVALVFGASGISGWALTKNLLSYPTPTTFARVTGLTNRPLAIEDSGLPQEDSRLELVHGVNLRCPYEEVRDKLRNTVKGLENVTHVYYLAYANFSEYAKDVMDLMAVNRDMTRNAVKAVDELCPKMEVFLLQTGTNNYGVAVYDHLGKFPIIAPLREDMPRVPAPYGDELFYYKQFDIIKEVQKGKSWAWCDVRPDSIIGFVPHLTIMTVAEPLAHYLSLYRYIHGAGAIVPWPGARQSYIYTFTNSSQDIITRSEIFVSLQPKEKINSQSYNIGDNTIPTSWRMKWPLVCAWFGLKGVPPEGFQENSEYTNQVSTTNGADMVYARPSNEKDKHPMEEWSVKKFWENNQPAIKEMREKYGLKDREVPASAWNFLYALMWRLDINRELDLTKIRELGYKEELAVERGWEIAFERMASHGVVVAWSKSKPYQLT